MGRALPPRGLPPHLRTLADASVTVVHYLHIVERAAWGRAGLERHCRKRTTPGIPDDELDALIAKAQALLEDAIDALDRAQSQEH